MKNLFLDEKINKDDSGYFESQSYSVVIVIFEFFFFLLDDYSLSMYSMYSMNRTFFAV